MHNENIVLAQEIVRSFKHMKRKKGFLGLKIDFQKAYDRMKWIHSKGPEGIWLQ